MSNFAEFLKGYKSYKHSEIESLDGEFEEYNGLYYRSEDLDEAETSLQEYELSQMD